ncbi:MAG: response regulator transcription factor [Acidobacteria bacterium]|nr:response regulator transcription factor [Acidobacteriota bacterium]
MSPQPSRGPDSAPPIARVAVLDEYPFSRAGLTDGIAAAEGFTVCCSASTGDELIAHLSTCSCAVVVAEPWLRSDDGLDALARIGHDHPDITIVAFSRVWDRERVQQVMALGARAYVPKTTAVATLPGIIRRAMDGLVTVPQDHGDHGRTVDLTTREFDVLRLAADGRDNAGIAADLAIAERTVKFHLQNAYRKLGASNRTEAAAIARRQGILS